MEQKRLLIAFVLSAAILFGWTYYTNRSRPQQPTSPDPLQQATSTPAQTANTSSVAPLAQQAPIAAVAAQDAIPQRTVTIKSPLYDVTLDSRGAVATSWIINKNKDTNRELFSVAGSKSDHQKLQLLHQAESLPENLRLEAHATPLRLVTGDQTLDGLLASRNYQIDGVDTNGGDVIVDLKPGDVKALTMTLRDEATGVEAVKSFNFSAETYSVDLGAKLTRGGQPVPSVKLAIGPSIGDQGVSQYTYYSVAPGGVAAVDGKAEIYDAKSIHETKEHPDQEHIGGSVDWAGVGDTYFAMLAIPAKKTQGLEFHTTRYEQPDSAGKNEERFLITGLLDVPADGSPTRIYVGPKDYFLLTTASENITQAVGRKVDLDQAINFGRLGFITRPLGVPILKAIKLLSKWTGSYGVAIILFTIIIYSLFFPLKWRSTKAMKKAQIHAPRLKELQAKMKGLKQTDPQLRELQMEQLRLMKEANPLGGCLPLLIQMPFLFALYTAITISIDFRQASFLWLPDLSAADPYRLLPILMAGSMVVLQFITPQPSADPLQRKMMAVMLPAFMLYIMWSAPAGLLIYWLMANLVGFGQQMLINRLTKTGDDEGPQPPGKKGARTPRTPLDQRRTAAV